MIGAFECAQIVCDSCRKTAQTRRDESGALWAPAGWVVIRARGWNPDEGRRLRWDFCETCRREALERVVAAIGPGWTS